MRHLGHWAAAALGGGLGSLARYLMQGWVQRRADHLHGRAESFPWGTFAVNILGCLLIGFLVGAFELRGRMTPETRTFVLVGLLGGFTTFSSLGLESFSLLRSGGAGLAFANLAGSSIAGLAAVALGFWLSEVLA
ncbi:MAG: fluoride efflux transporter CrcB [Thermoanaerobaculia bacterium]